MLQHMLRQLMFRPRIAVVFHIYYEDIAKEIIARRKNIRSPYSLYVTHNHDLTPDTITALAGLQVRLRFLKTENIGMDVYPFLAALEHFGLFETGLLCKLHTKRGEGPIGDTWKTELFDSILGDGSRFDSNIRYLAAHSHMAMLGAASTYLSAHHAMKDNFPHIFDLNQACLYADLKQDWGFFAGTIFLARSRIFHPLPKASIIRQRFARGATRSDGEFAHACERVFGLLPRLGLQDVGTITPAWRGEEVAVNPLPSPELISRTMTELHKKR
ncbi:MAG: rhamnan synthesis F family protein [Paracoccaceae bacterium]